MSEAPLCHQNNHEEAPPIPTTPDEHPVPPESEQTPTLRELAVANGHEEAFDIAVEQLGTVETRTVLAAIASTFKMPSHEIDDLLQSVAIRILKNPQHIDIATRKFTTLARIATNILIDKYRKDVMGAPNHQRDLVLDFTDEGSLNLSEGTTNAYILPPLPDEVPQRLDLLVLTKAVATLPEGQKEAIWRFYVMGMSHTEIAQILGTSTGGSKLLAFRGIRKLREILDRNDFERE